MGVRVGKGWMGRQVHVPMDLHGHVHVREAGKIDVDRSGSRIQRGGQAGQAGRC